MKFEKLNTYDINWKDFTQTILSEPFDLVSEVINGFSNYLTPDQISDQLIKDNPDYEIKNLDDGYTLEAEKLLAIQQKSSRGFKVIDINPGLLGPLDFPLNLPFEFLFDGTNFLNNQNDNYVENFRSVNIPVQGNFLKVEYINEINTTANLTTQIDPTTFLSRPKAEIKYSDAFPTSDRTDLVTGQTTYSFDNFARTKIFIDFGSSSNKPHLLGQSNKIFKGYFNEINIHLNIGAPKIRITVGFNSEVLESSDASSINSKLHLTGAARLLNDIDQVMSPFNYTDYNLVGQENGISLTTLPSNISTVDLGLIACDYVAPISGAIPLQTYGYSVLWLTNLNFRLKNYDLSTAPAGSFFKIEIYIRGYTASIGGVSQNKQVYSDNLSFNDENYQKTFSEPKRVVIPEGATLMLRMSFITPGVTGQAILNFSIDGYSLGELLLDSNGVLVTSKYLTDAVFMSDFNRIESIKVV